MDPSDPPVPTAEPGVQVASAPWTPVAVRAVMRQMFEAAVAAAQPSRCVPAHLPPRPVGRVVVVGAGKASAAMARAVEDHWQGALTGLVVTRHGHAVPCRQIEIIEAAHPVPDAAGHAAAQRMLNAVRGLSSDDLVLCLFSGGGSALLPLPVPGITLADKQALSRALLASGATISEINCVRRHLSAIKGGRLALACHPARVVNLLISDVPGDDPIDIASGPTVPDPTTRADALAVLQRHAVVVPPRVRAWLESQAGQTPPPGDARWPDITTTLVATPRMALEAAAQVARGAGLAVHILGDAIEGEARDVGRAMAGLARQVARGTGPVTPPCVLLSGGETTVTVRGQGRGGRNVEFLLALTLALDGDPAVHVLAADTDGVDGQGDIAGAFAAPDTLRRARALGLDAQARLDDNDAHGFFGALGDALHTGPTYTNVNDFRAIVILPLPVMQRATDDGA